MLSTTATILAIIAAVGSGVVAGVLYAFSAFGMPGLRVLPPDQGAAAMQEMNIKAVRAPFMIPFMGTTIVSVVVAWLATSTWVDAASGWIVGGAALYVVGVFVITAAFHVPRNNALAVVDPTSQSGQDVWIVYARVWTLGNHVRSVLGMAAAIAFTIGAVVG